MQFLLNLHPVKVVDRIKVVDNAMLTLQQLMTSVFHHAILTARYQLAQSVLKIGSALAESVRQGEVGRHSHDMLCTWYLCWLAVEKPWSALGWPNFSPFLHQRAQIPLLCFVRAPLLAL